MTAPSDDPVLGSTLLPGERVAWTGRPDHQRLLTFADVFAVPFTLLWGGFAITLSILSLIRDDMVAPPSVEWVMVTIWALVGGYLIVGRFLVKRWRRRRTVYAVTDRRVLSVRRSMWSRKAASAYLEGVDELSDRVRADGSGTIWIGRWPWWARFAEDLGLHGYVNSALWWTKPTGLIVLHDIPSVREVIDLIDRGRSHAGG